MMLCACPITNLRVVSPSGSSRLTPILQDQTVTLIHRAGTPSGPISYGFGVMRRGGSAQRALPGFWSSSFPRFLMAISITAIRIKSGFSRISRCRGPGTENSFVAEVRWRDAVEEPIPEVEADEGEDRPPDGAVRDLCTLYVCIWIDAVKVRPDGPAPPAPPLALAAMAVASQARLPFLCSRRAVVVGLR